MPEVFNLIGPDESLSPLLWGAARHRQSRRALDGVGCAFEDRNPRSVSAWQRAQSVWTPCSRCTTIQRILARFQIPEEISADSVCGHTLAGLPHDNRCPDDFLTVLLPHSTLHYRIVGCLGRQFLMEENWQDHTEKEKIPRHDLHFGEPSLRWERSLERAEYALILHTPLRGKGTIGPLRRAACEG
jgi:hypothetical protein